MIHDFKFKNTYKFREAAIYFEQHGCYNDGGIKDTLDYNNYWNREFKRCLEGLVIEGIRISGYHYFYLNYCPIEQVRSLTSNKDKTSKSAAERFTSFPKFWDLDWIYFTVLDIAEYGIAGETLDEKIENYNKLPIELNLNLNLENLNGGKHLLFLKARGIGASWKGGSMPARNFFFVRNSKSYMYADSTQYLIKDGVFNKFLTFKNFINQNTPFYKYTDVKNDLAGMHIRASHKDLNGNEKGFMSEVMAVTVAGKPDSIRGKRGKVTLFEEFGTFNKGGDAWEVSKSSHEEGNLVFGTMVAYGCVCAGTMVWTGNGNYIKIEDLYQDDNILGYDIIEGKTSNEVINCHPIGIKECVRITTNTGRYLECSVDHPILHSSRSMNSRPRCKENNKKRLFKKTMSFKEASKLSIDDQVAIIEEIPFFGTMIIEEPRLIGWLIGDGSYGFDQTPRIANCDEEILNYVTSNFETSISAQHITKTGKIYQDLRIKNITKLLRLIGIYGQTKQNKRLPWFIHKCDKKTIVELLGGFYDTDGHVSKASIVLTSSCYELLDQTRVLCQKLGIHGTINKINPNIKEDRKDKNPWYVFTICDIKSISVFKENIEFKLKYKQEALNLLVENNSCKKSLLSNNIKGLRFEKIVKIEELGEKEIYNLTAGVTETYIANGIVTHNTAGLDGKAFETMEKMFFNPRVFGLLEFDNIFDDDLMGTQCAFFLPATYNVAYVDKEGNTDQITAREFIDKERAKKLKSTDPLDAAKAKMEHPLKPSEALLRVTNSILPKAELLTHKTQLVASGNLHNLAVYGFLEDTKDGVKFKPTEDARPVLKYPHDLREDNQGCISLWEAPYRTENGSIPDNLYVVCVDPYMHDSSQGDSLGAAYVIKNINNFSRPDDMIVASFVGRPASMDLFHKHIRQLSEYYNAKIGYENNAGQGLLSYFKNNKKLHLLAPEFELGYNENIPKSSVKRGFGMHIDGARKKLGISYLADWLVKQWMTTEDGEILYNYHKINDVGLLDELIKYQDDRNVDRVSALIIAMFHLKEIEYKIGIISDRDKNVDTYFSMPLFQ